MMRSVLLALGLSAAFPVTAGVRAGDSFDRTIAPLLARRCLDCHDGPKPKGGLNLASRETTFKGGKNGAVLVPGKLDQSLLWDVIRDGKMPPKKPLADHEKSQVRDWIAGGAKWGADPIDPYRYTTDTRAGYDWWSLQPVKPAAPPAVKDQSWPRNGIDRFVLAKLEERSLRPSPAAERRALIRRLSFDLVGLPPTPAEVEAFVRDDAADAYERLVDRLLASPHYGERWARHWLDLVRFGESNGFEHDELRKNAWPYRDWVVNALNRDMPYDEFARLQLAGDVLRPEDGSAIAATGFLVAGSYDTVGQKQQSAAMRAVVRQDELEDMVSAVGQTFLGLTVHCARCHDHKFDPVRQNEYYRLTAALAGVKPGERDISSAQEREENDKRLAATKPAIGKDEKPQKPALLKPAYAVAPQTPEPTYVLLRGDTMRKGSIVTAGAVASVVGMDADFGLLPTAPDAARRAKLAEWITSTNNPLFARVIVNRLWHHHFGIGLVDTPNDFGFHGGRPSHPELLDWLAAELVRGKWSLKNIHRLIVTSATYRQQSRFEPAAAKVDANNRMLWRKSPLRLEAEAVRDAMLLAAGKLNPQMGGSGYRDFSVVVRGATYYYPPLDDDRPEVNRRTLYRTWARSGRSALLDNLDCPDPSTITPKRAVTTTPLQTLALLNNAFVLRMADHFAERLRRDAGTDGGKQVELAYALALGRSPSKEERDQGITAVERHGASVLCRALLNSSEFVYVD